MSSYGPKQQRYHGDLITPTTALFSITVGTDAVTWAPVSSDLTHKDTLQHKHTCTHTHTVVFSWLLRTLHWLTHYLPNPNPYPHLKLSLHPKIQWFLLWGLSFCPHMESESPQCDCVIRFMSPQRELTHTHTHTSYLPLQEKVRSSHIASSWIPSPLIGLCFHVHVVHF